MDPFVSLRSASRRPLLSSFVFLSSLVLPALAAAQVVVVPEPVVGSSNPITAEPPVRRPSTSPCVVTLLKNQEFGDYSGKPITYTPPTGCKGPWSKVVLTADFTVTAGRQYDRTASFYLGNANIFYGTTAEPRSALSPSWHIERDLTDLTAIFKTAQTGQAIVYNIVNSTYTGIIYGSAYLEFYPVSTKDPAPVVPDVVVPVSSANNAATLNTTTDQVTQTLNLPRNTEKVYLDVIAQSQSNDEFWYLCVPDDQASPLITCGNTAFRETEITIDGSPAGVAPIYPWIYTGGLDPYLWEPITGVQTLNFKPYRVDLTPFAGLLSDGNTHTVGVSVYNANSYFLATANLLAYEDHGSLVVSGGVLSNSLSAAPTPQVTESLAVNSAGNTIGTISDTSARQYTVTGYVQTSHGRVDTSVEAAINFSNVQKVDVNANSGPEIQNIVQATTVAQTVTTKSGAVVQIDSKEFSYPLVLDYAYGFAADGSSTQAVTSNQKDLFTESLTVNGIKQSWANSTEEVNATDTLNFNASGALTAAGKGKTSASYVGKDSTGSCFTRTLAAVNQKLTAATTSISCK